MRPVDVDAGALVAKENPEEIEGAIEETLLDAAEVVPNGRLVDTGGAGELKLKPVDGADAVVAGVENKLPAGGTALVCVPKAEPNSAPVDAAVETGGGLTLPKLNPVEGVWDPKAGARVV